jgi:hypothetical protein
MSNSMNPGALNRGGQSDRLRSSLARVVPRTPANASELWTLRRRAWRESGVIVLRPEEIADDYARQALINAANALLGERAAPFEKERS